jgi:PGF-CTERM protein
MIDSPPTDRIASVADRLRDCTLTSRSSVSIVLVAVLALSAAAVPAAAQSDGAAFQLETDSVSSTANVTLAGTATLDPGTELQVRVRSAGDTEPRFLQTDAATVADDGSWESSFNLSAVETHDSITVTVVAADGNQTADFDVPVRDDQATPTETGTGTSTPGFGVVVALGGVLGGVLALRRRHAS